MKTVTHAPSIFKRFRTNESGGIAIMFALMLPVIFGVVGLGVESGQWFKERRELQSLADAAAVSAAIENSYGATSTEITAAAQLEADQNGFDNSTDTMTYVGTPVTGAFIGEASYVEVTVSRTLSTILSQVFYSISPITYARAVATTGNSDGGEACLLALDDEGPAVSVSGNGSVTFDGCEVASNSQDSNSLNVTGSGGLSVDCYSVVGDVNVTAGLTTSDDCEAVTSAASITDPYLDLEDPDDGGCDVSGGLVHNSTSTITIGNGNFTDPYVICSGDLWVMKGTVIIDGLVVIQGSFKVNANGSVESGDDGSTIIIKDGGSLGTINGSASIDLSAPPSGGIGGDWEGILFYQDRDTSAECTGNCNVINGNAGSQFEGVIYIPNQELVMSGGNTTDYTCLQMVALRTSFTGNSDIFADNDCTAAGVNPITVPGPYYAKLVE